MSIVNQIAAFEAGEMDEDEVIDFFQHLLDTGVIYHLQGSYQRTANNLLRAGLLIQK